MLSKRTAATAVMALCLAASQPSLATLATSNLNGLLNSGVPIGPNPNSLRAQSFTVANDQDYVLTEVQIYENLANANVFLRIYSDNASQPGAILEQLSFASSAPVSITAVSGSIFFGAALTFTSSGLSLTAGGSYWLVGSSTTGGVLWFGTNSTAETGLSGWTIANTNRLSNNAGATWNANVGTPMYLAINGGGGGHRRSWPAAPPQSRLI